jgi:hypothetical protein
MGVLGVSLYLSDVNNGFEMLFPIKKASLLIVLHSLLQAGNCRREHLTDFRAPVG